jgi:repressor LexA
MASDDELEPAREASIDAQNVNADNAAVEPTYTETQGQYLAFIYYYTKIHGVPPAEADMQRYFNVSPPSVHNMVVTLEKRRLIQRTPGAGRSIRLLLTRDKLPDLA